MQKKALEKQDEFEQFEDNSLEKMKSLIDCQLTMIEKLCLVASDWYGIKKEDKIGFLITSAKYKFFVLRGQFKRLECLQDCVALLAEDFDKRPFILKKINSYQVDLHNGKYSYEDTAIDGETFFMVNEQIQDEFLSLEIARNVIFSD